MAVQEDGEEATTFVDLSVIFAPIIEQEEAYVRRRDGGREVKVTKKLRFKFPKIYEIKSISGAHHLSSASPSSGPCCLEKGRSEGDWHQFRGCHQQRWRG